MLMGKITIELGQASSGGWRYFECSGKLDWAIKWRRCKTSFGEGLFVAQQQHNLDSPVRLGGLSSIVSHRET